MYTFFINVIVPNAVNRYQVDNANQITSAFSAIPESSEPLSHKCVLVKYSAFEQESLAVFSTGMPSNFNIQLYRDLQGHN